MKRHPNNTMQLNPFGKPITGGKAHEDKDSHAVEFIMGSDYSMGVMDYALIIPGLIKLTLYALEFYGANKNLLLALSFVELLCNIAKVLTCLPFILLQVFMAPVIVFFQALYVLHSLKLTNDQGKDLSWHQLFKQSNETDYIINIDNNRLEICTEDSIDGSLSIVGYIKDTPNLSNVLRFIFRAKDKGIWLGGNVHNPIRLHCDSSTLWLYNEQKKNAQVKKAKVEVAHLYRTLAFQHETDNDDKLSLTGLPKEVRERIAKHYLQAESQASPDDHHGFYNAYENDVKHRAITEVTQAMEAKQLK